MQLDLIRQLSGCVVFHDSHLVGLLHSTAEAILPGTDGSAGRVIWFVLIPSFASRSRASSIVPPVEPMPTINRSGSSCGASTLIGVRDLQAFQFAQPFFHHFFAVSGLSIGRPSSSCSTPVTW